MKVYLAIIIAGISLPLSFAGIGIGLIHSGPPAPRLTCADVDRIVPSIAKSNGSTLGTVACTEIIRTGPSRWEAKAILTQTGEVRYWTFSLIYDPYLIFDAKQIGSATVPSG